MTTSITSSSITTTDLTVDSADNLLKVDHATNRVGIGTTSPSNLLTLKADSTEETMLMFQNDSAVDIGAIAIHPSNGLVIANQVPGSSVHIMTHDGNEDINLDSDGFIQFEVAGSELLRLTNTGVGIDNSNPSQRLTVNSPGGAGANAAGKYSEVMAQIHETGGQTESGRRGIMFFNDINNWYNGTEKTVFGMAFNNNGDIRGGIQYDHKNTERMTIWSGYGPIEFKVPSNTTGDYRADQAQLTPLTIKSVTGNVGIGTANPGVNLEVSDSGNSFILVKNTSSGSGLYIKADTDGDAELQTAGGNNTIVMRTSGQERMRINSDGVVTIPNQPSFQAYRSQSAWTVTAGSIFVFNNTEHNIGSHYNTGNGRFTAPVAGTYQFSFHTIYTGNSGNDWISIRKNGARINGGDYHFSTTPGTQWDTIGGSLNLYLNINDHVSMYAGTEHVYHGGNWSNFGGHLVG